MIKKDYKLFAEMFKDEKETLENTANILGKKDPKLDGMIFELREIENKLMSILKQDNERFDAQKFIEYIE